MVNLPLSSCLPYTDEKYCYFRFYRDENFWVGWFPRKFFSALKAYIKPMKRTDVIIHRIATHGTAEYLMITGAGIGLSILVYVAVKQMHGRIQPNGGDSTISIDIEKPNRRASGVKIGWFPKNWKPENGRA
jgi:hypothetical protein